MSRSQTVILGLLILMLGGPAAEAQRISSPYEFVERKRDLGVFAGYLLTDRGEARLGPKSGPVVGVQGTLRLSDPLNLSVIGAYVFSERDVRDLVLGDTARLVTVGAVEQNLILAVGRLHLNLTGARTWNNLIPHVLIGLGLAFDATADPSCLLDVRPIQCTPLPRERFDFSTSIMGEFGFGTVWLPSERIGLRLEILDAIWRLETPDGFFDEGVNLESVPPETDWTNNLQLSAAFTFWF